VNVGDGSSDDYHRNLLRWGHIFCYVAFVLICMLIIFG
jgi:hypothetical protein